mgnify:CR=1 FL=1
MSQYKFIEDALKKEAPYVIRELRTELENQQHIASRKLYDGFRDRIKIGSDIANNDYLSAGTRGATMLIPGFTKSKQFGTSVKHHALKLANSSINTEPSNIQNYQTQFRDGGVRYSRRRMGYVSRNIL